MTDRTVSPTWFSEKLLSVLDETGTTIRGLAKRLNPGRPENARRTLHRYLAGRVPGQPRRREIADAIGIDPSRLEPDDDEEDDRVVRVRRIASELAQRGLDQLAADLLALVVDLRRTPPTRAHDEAGRVRV